MHQITLTGAHVRLEPLHERHIDALTAAASDDPELYRWSLVPQGRDAVCAYVRAALARRDEGTCVPFAIVRASDEAVVGSTRFFDLERWAWPREHPRAQRESPDGCEIGYTWLASHAIRTPVNTETKVLMFAHAFEAWDALRVCFHTDVRNERSARALERIGARFEGVLRSHRMASDFTPRDSKRYSIVAAEWPQIKARLRAATASYPSGS